MASRFIALPVGKGDSFFLKRGEHTVLFDGGLARNSLPALIVKHIGCQRIDVVICSHNDADHAKGLIGLLEDPSISISEVWLPGRWLDGIQAIHAMGKKEFISEVLENSTDSGADSLEEYSAQISGDEKAAFGEDNDIKVDDVILNALEDIDEEFQIQLGAQIFHHYLFHLFSSRLFMESIEAADRILKIASLAHRRGCKIRWFDFRTFQRTSSTGGGEDWLRPLNSVECVRVKRARFKALEWIALTVSNRESLAFASTSQTGEPSVVFSADSDLQKVAFPNLQNTLVTAPHHGAAANSNVYSLPNLNASVWVRSDFRTAKRPCSAYRSTQQVKFCTRCNCIPTFEQCVVLECSKNIWTPIAGTTPCLCPAGSIGAGEGGQPDEKLSAAPNTSTGEQNT